MIGAPCHNGASNRVLVEYGTGRAFERHNEITLPRLGSTLWPKLGFSYSNTDVSTDLAAGPNTTISSGASGSHVALNVFVPVMFHPVPHFFLGFGPALDTDLSGDARTTTVAGRLTIGGWM